MKFDLHAELLQLGVAFTPLNQQAAHAFDQRWSAAFTSVPPPKRSPYRWHAFHMRLYPCLVGASALSAYLNQWQAPFYVFDEALGFCALCEAQPFPDLSVLSRDLYVAHRNLKWTMAFTHEQPQIGPFFAQRPVI